MTAAYPTLCPDCGQPVTRARSAATGRTRLLDELHATPGVGWQLDQAGYAYPSGNGQYTTHTCTTTSRETTT